MMVLWKKALWGVLVLPFVLLGIWLSRLDRGIDMQLGVRRGEPLQVVVDGPPLPAAGREDVQNVRRDYAPLGRFLEETLGRQVEISYARHLERRAPGSGNRRI